MDIEIITKNADGTIKLGEKIGRGISSPMVIALYGELGAGKTVLAQGIAKGLGISDYVTSPTFIVISEFKGRLDLYHIDLYRMETASQIEDLGIEEYFTKENGVCVIEWAEKLGELLPDNSAKIHLSILSENERKIVIKGMNIK